MSALNTSPTALFIDIPVIKVEKVIKRPLAEPSTILSFKVAAVEASAVPSPAPLPALIHLPIKSVIIMIVCFHTYTL